MNFIAFIKVCKGLRRSLRALTRHDGDDIRHIYRKRPINLGSIANLTMAVAAPALGYKVELKTHVRCGKIAVFTFTDPSLMMAQV